MCLIFDLLILRFNNVVPGSHCLVHLSLIKISMDGKLVSVFVEHSPNNTERKSRFHKYNFIHLLFIHSLSPVIGCLSCLASPIARTCSDCQVQGIDELFGFRFAVGAFQLAAAMSTIFGTFIKDVGACSFPAVPVFVQGTIGNIPVFPPSAISAE